MVETLIIWILGLILFGMVAKPFIQLMRWLKTQIPEGDTESIQALTIVGDCPIIDLKQLDGKPIKFHSISRYQVADEQLWILQLENNGPLVAWTDDASIAWTFNELKKGTAGMLVNGQLINL
mgnify:FL=1